MTDTTRKALEAKLPEPDVNDAHVHVYPSDIYPNKTGERTITAFSIPVGCPGETSIPLFTADQVKTHALDFGESLATPAALEAEGWRPIETAKKNQIWKVKIDCWYRDKPRAKVHNLVRRTVIVDADDADAAFAIATKHVQSTAAFGPKWIAFEPRECVSAELPLGIAAFYGQTRPSQQKGPT